MKSAISEAFDSWLVSSTKQDRTTTGKGGVSSVTLDPDTNSLRPCSCTF